MSYDRTNQRFSRRAAADLAAATELQDRRLVSFLARLVAAEICLTEWEESFCSSVLYHHAQRPTVLTAGQRRACEKLRKSYAHRLPIPAPDGRGQMANGRGEKPASERGTCDWKVRGEDGRQTRCGRKAGVRSPGGLEFCQDHHEVRLAWKKRQQELRSRR